jgi:hypothetical protein
MRLRALMGLVVGFATLAAPAISQQEAQWLSVANSDSSYSFVQTGAIGQGQGWIMRIYVGPDQAQRQYRSRIFRSMGFYEADCAGRTLRSLEGVVFAEPSGAPAGSWNVPDSPNRVIPDSIGEREYSALCDVGNVEHGEPFALSVALELSIAILNEDQSSPKE